MAGGTNSKKRDSLATGPGRKSIEKTLIQGAAGSFATRLLGTGIAFGAHAVIARLLGVDSYGTYFFVLTIINLLAMFCKFGLDTATLRFVPTYIVQTSWGLAVGFLRRSLQTAFLGAVFVSLALFTLVWAQEGMVPDLRRTFLFGCLVLPLTVLLQMRAFGLQALKHVVLAQIPPEIARPALLFLGIVSLVALEGKPLTAPQAMAVELLAVCASWLGAAYLLGRFTPQAMIGAPGEYRTKEWIQTAVPLSLISGLFLLLNNTGTILVGTMAGTAEAGMFGVSARLATLIGFGLIAANSIGAPLISELFWQKRQKDLQRMVSLVALGAFSFSVFVAAGMIVGGSFLLSLFGEQFRESYWALVILAVGQVVNAFSGPSGLLMTLTGNQGRAARIVLEGVLLNLALCVVLVPQYSFAGAAMAATAGMSYWNVRMMVYIRRVIKVDSTFLCLVTKYHGT